MLLRPDILKAMETSQETGNLSGSEVNENGEQMQSDGHNIGAQSGQNHHESSGQKMGETQKDRHQCYYGDGLEDCREASGPIDCKITSEYMTIPWDTNWLDYGEHVRIKEWDGFCELRLCYMS
jgi:hypothetical protein